MASESISASGRILPLHLHGVAYTVSGKTLVHDVSATLPGGGLTMILGPNGAGKSLLVRMCHGLLAPTEGRIAWMGPAGGEAARHQAIVFQRPVLLRRPASANLRHALRLQGRAREERERLLREALEVVGLSALAHRQARVLSGGEQQRLALARAWALQPQVLFLDEPTTNLDPAAVRKIEAVILEMQASGTDMVMTTHDLSQARRLAQRVLFLHHGRLLEDTPAEQFFAGPSTPEAQAFLRGELLD
jgi:tungstate transport system ATP-binding protein